MEPDFDLLAHLIRQQEWSFRNFGPPRGTEYIKDHVNKELGEIWAKPHDLTEWVDVMILAADGAFRSGSSPVDMTNYFRLLYNDAHPGSPFFVAAYLSMVRVHSLRWNGSGQQTQVIIQQIREQLAATDGDRRAWFRIWRLAADGAMRLGFTPREVLAALVAKQEVNEGRKWPDWRTVEPGKAIEHIRED